MANEPTMALVRDLTGRLAALAAEVGIRLDSAGGLGGAAVPANKRALAADLLHQRAIRADHFPAELFHEPAWDMLLALYVAGEDRQATNIKALVTRTPAPATTAQRWLDHLHRLGLIHRIVDPADRRRVEISLTEQGARMVDAYLDRIGGLPAA